MGLLWQELKAAVPLIIHGNPYLWSVIWFTVQVTVVATLIAAVIGLPVAAVIAVGRFRGQAILQWLANAAIAVPPVLSGLFLYMLFVPSGPFGSLHLIASREVVFIAQAFLAIPYVVALGAAAMQGVNPGVVRQARSFGAGGVMLAVLVLREARRGVLAAIAAAAGATLAEVGAVIVVGANVYGYNQTLASSMLFDANAAHYADALASGIVLIGLIVVVIGGITVFQERRELVAAR